MKRSNGHHFSYHWHDESSSAWANLHTKPTDDERPWAVLAIGREYTDGNSSSDVSIHVHDVAHAHQLITAAQQIAEHLEGATA